MIWKYLNENVCNMFSQKYLIVLINYKNWNDTIECIHSLIGAGVNNSDIFVINNSPNDYFPSANGQALKDIEIIDQNNIGFSGGCNIGIKRGIEKSVEYIILLNNDTIVEPQSISVLLGEMDKFKNVALGTGQIRFYPEKEIVWYAGGELNYWRGLAIHCHENKNVNRISLEQQPQFVSFVSGCFLCIRTSDIEKLGFLNEKFFLYLEDIEYSARAVQNSLRLLYVPRSIIYHKCRGERHLSEQTLYYAVRNRNLLIKLSFPMIARYYFYVIIRIKMIYWFFRNKKLYRVSKKGLMDYKNNNFGKISIT